MDVIAEPGGGAAPLPSSPSSPDIVLGTDENAPDLGGGGGSDENRRRQRQDDGAEEDAGHGHEPGLAKVGSTSVQTLSSLAAAAVTTTTTAPPSHVPSLIASNTSNSSSSSSSFPSDHNAAAATDDSNDNDPATSNGDNLNAAAAITPPLSLTPRDEDGDNSNISSSSNNSNNNGEDDRPAAAEEAEADAAVEDPLLSDKDKQDKQHDTDERNDSLAAAAAAAPPTPAESNDNSHAVQAPSPSSVDGRSSAEFLSRKEWMALQQKAERGRDVADSNGAVVEGAAVSAAPSSASTTAVAALKKPPPPGPPRAVEIIDLLDSESDDDDNEDDTGDDSDDDEENGSDNADLPPRKHQAPADSGGFHQPPYGPSTDAHKKQRVDSQLAHSHIPPGHNNSMHYPSMPLPHHPSVAIRHPPPHGGAMSGMPPPRPDAPLLSAPAIPGPPLHQHPRVAPMIHPPHLRHPQQHHIAPIGAPVYVPYPPGFRPTWAALMPDLRPRPPPVAAAEAATAGPPRRKRYKLSLLNVNQFTITGLPPEYNEPPTSIAGLRVPIRQIARDHGRAVFDQEPSVDGDSASAGNNVNNSGPGRWRIPLGAYHAFYAYLVSDPNTRVEGIPPHQLQIASLERARQEKGYPSVEAIAERGVPPLLAKALAPFQRGGVDFVVEKGGRALIADGACSAFLCRLTCLLSDFVSSYIIVVHSRRRTSFQLETDMGLGVRL
jgi:hypothetical protein